MTLLPGFEPRRVRVLSYGGGLDSFAMLVDAIGRGELPELVVFADVADPAHEDPGEWPETYAHIRDVAQPLCAAHGIEFAWLDSTAWPVRGERSLWAYYEKTTSMPGRVSRLCTSAAKVDRIRRYLQSRFAGQPLEVWIGFEAGEDERVERDPHAKGDGWRVSRFPLIERRLCRCRAEALVRAAGHPVPVKSACVFCPFGTRGDFARLRAEYPEVFARLEGLERGSKLTRAGARMTFGGDERPLDEWTTGRKPYLPLVRTCTVCGAAKSKPLAPSARPPVTWGKWETSWRAADGHYLRHAVRTLRGETRHGRRVTVTVRDGDTWHYRRSKSVTVRIDTREVYSHSILDGRWQELGDWGKREAEARAKQEHPATAADKGE